MWSSQVLSLSGPIPTSPAPVAGLSDAFDTIKLLCLLQTLRMRRGGHVWGLFEVAEGDLAFSCPSGGSGWWWWWGVGGGGVVVRLFVHVH